MHLRPVLLAALFAVALPILPMGLRAADSPPALQASGTWSFAGIAHPFTVTAATRSAEAQPNVIYLRNLQRARLGSDSDATIIGALVADGLAVIDLDCAGLPAESMALERALLEFHGAVESLVREATSGRLKIDLNALYWVPEGHRLSRRLPFWNLAQHGSHGTLERILEIHNSTVVERFGVAPIGRVNELRGRDGAALDYDLYIDLVHPSGAASTPAPVIAHYATQSRMPQSFRSGDRPMELIGWLTSGYALALVDHAYNPLARSEHYRHFQPGYTLQDHNDLKVGSASIRFLRAHADAFNLTDRIGVLGHSKSSYTTIRLADPRHPDQPEHARYRGFPPGTPEAQPWPGFASTVQVAFASMGNGTRRVQYVNEHLAPIVFAVGRTDRFGHWEVFPPLIAAAEQTDAHHLALWMEDLGHDRPFGTDLLSGKERHLLLRQFFAQHLHPYGREDLEVLFTLPHADAEGVSLDGVTRVLTRAEDLPKDMHGLPATRPITVRFARAIDASSTTGGGLSVWDLAANTPVPGTWRSSLRHSRFEFTPDRPLAPLTLYEIRVATSVHDTAHRHLAAPVHHRFRTRAVTD